ncbi:40ddd489-e041-4fed-ad20-01afb5df08ca [Thermothielavioides terrestris]|uniref:40ddd489-e041-4fed-ad20-01afb5df08ca n=1 Tax=Thermothielavioides terrestris TaxID=2587410 RepID=A0A446BCP4_9PEZI|nr:40ddd489-e041-4fed-ad20-01afb5df08ca [Thermothielavioides terrestris]
MKPRLGLPADLEAVTDVIIRTMPLDPQWDYRFPYRRLYPEDHYKYTRMLFEYFLDPSYDDWLVMVVEDSAEPGGPVTEVEKRGGKARRDANHAHFNAFWKGQIQAYQKYFGPLGPEQIHLQILATLPGFQRRGHGSSLCRWGMERVRLDSLRDMSVMASPMGYELYTWLGFETVGTFYIQVPGEDEKIVLRAMMYRPPKQPGATL